MHLLPSSRTRALVALTLGFVCSAAAYACDNGTFASPLPVYGNDGGSGSFEDAATGLDAEGTGADGGDAGSLTEGGASDAGKDSGDAEPDAGVTQDAAADAADAGTCQGSPAPCSSFLSSNTCLTELGCTDTLALCSGNVPSCSVQNETSCNAIMGCLWDSSSSSCGGVSEACNIFSDGTSCVQQTGCSWTPFVCNGTVLPCSEVAPLPCSIQPGCSLQ